MGIFGIFSDSNKKAAKREQQAGLNKGRTLAMGDLDRGQSAYDMRADQAYGEYDPYVGASTGASNLYADALGINGADAANAARDSFTNSAGYDFNRDEQLLATERAGSKYGWNGTGNLATALQDRASDLASQEANNWYDRLANLRQEGIGIAGNRANIRTGQGTAAYNTGGTKANLNFAAETGIGQAGAEYEKSKDQSGLNIFDAVMGGLKLASGWGG